MTDAAVAPRAEEDKILPAVVYGLYLLGFTNGLTFFVGLIVAYVNRDAAGPINASHYTFAIRTFWLAIAWLIGFVFLPWPSTMYGAGDHWGSTSVTLFTSDGTGALYWWTMAYISGIGTLASIYINRHPYLIKPSDRSYWAGLTKTRARLRGAAFFIVFVIAGLATLVYPFLGYWSLLLIWPLNFLLQPSKAQRSQLEDLRSQAEES